MFNADQTTAIYRGNVLDLGERRMQWLSQRQQILADNVANADTPGFVPSDASSFDAALSSFDIAPVVTSAMHMGGGRNGVRAVRDKHERAPDGNAVSLDAQMEKIANTDDQQRLASTLYKTYVSMFDTALDK
ncbi:flagellar basal-body rod protein FlgB [Ameyamaea chiangmaiensis NBRC 103196]|uniref:Flagellar biosynthesis protein FlgB n=1 Tax=Ameyamaea chiangmaiensis TaxID=442969 RepID=A0A850P8J9_9PROT|nr:flagellar basal body protein [Ameyamaea chiangmaiensis]MBS4075666.1 flagellar biosynthesis protein FlgB [Ameyamaea chiangmaiensis]NVN40917.1 flagellar biosynthesis protein FlgB [Ameyamaea chiangmaiensis]GBQ70597.1 flagellar basal-body rod protein FlgB [Ameyamaea chiangmaiensis NBRC 103196]